MKVLNKPKKSMGQNFLIDQNIIKKIIKIGNIDTDKKIIWNLSKIIILYLKLELDMEV